MKGPIANSYFVNKNLIAGEYPADEKGNLSKLETLKKSGVECFIDLTNGEWEGLTPYDFEKVKYSYWFAIKDVTAPTIKLVEEILGAIDYELNLGRKVYAHCKGGSGRTGTVIACWLVKHGHTAHDALAKVEAWWKKSSPNSPFKSPNTPEQCRMVKRYEQHVMPGLDRHLGCLVGLAVGDAIGATNEFKARGNFEPITDMVGGGVFGLKPGQWTDDTSMALCLGQSLLDWVGFSFSFGFSFSVSDQMAKYLDWYENGYMSSNGKCFDVGGATRNAILGYRNVGADYYTNSKVYPGAAGNGGIMRLAPVPMYYSGNNPEIAIEYCADSSRTTHGHKDATAAARYFGGLLYMALNGASKEDLLKPCASPLTKKKWLKSELSPAIYAVARGSYKTKTEKQISSSGYVVHSLEAALWCFYNSDSFEQGVLMAANLGDDADTVAAIYGQLAGAHYGIKNIPEKWKSKLAKKELIFDMAAKLYGAE